MQDQSLLNKLDIVSPHISKTINFNVKGQENKPIQLISFDDTNGFTVNPDAIQFFQSLQDNNLGVITIVGKNRTGKSYLLNRVVLNQNSGFSVGHTINPCTKGIWVWPNVIEIENKNNENEKINVVVMDTEGTDATDQHENYDTKIFILGMLLSSYFIYNSVGAIDEKAIQNLSLIINLSKHLQKANEKEFEDLMECFPSFLWVVRDFALKLIDPHGQPITSKEYLENALKPQKGFSEAAENKNRIRRLIANFFNDRDCYMMVRPMEAEKDIQALHTLNTDELRPEFNEQVNNLRRKIWLKVKPKQFRGKPINGPGFIVLCRFLCNMLNSGDALSIENSWNSICKIECEKLVQELGEKYETMMKKELDKGNFDQHTMGRVHKSKKTEITENFKKKALGDNVKDYEDMLDEMIKQKYAFIKKTYYNKVESRMKENVDERLGQLENKLTKKEFANFSQLLQEFKAAKFDLEEEYKGPEAREILLGNLFDRFFKQAETFCDEITDNLKQGSRIKKIEMDSLQDKINTLEKKVEEKNKETMETLQQAEADRARYKAELSSLGERLKQANEERHTYSSDADVKLAQLAHTHKVKEQAFESQIKELQAQIEKVTKDNKDLQADNMKKSVVQERTTAHTTHTKQIDELNRTISDLTRELELERRARKSSDLTQESMNKVIGVSAISMNALEKSHAEVEHKEVADKGAFDELVRENKELKTNVDLLNARIESNVEEFYIQRNELETKLQEIERHYREKQLQDEFTIATLKKRVRTYENADQIMLETNKNLSITLERADSRCFNLEKKIDKLKKYHKIFKHADEISCKYCSKATKKSLFTAHMEVCTMNESCVYEERPTNNPTFNVTFENQFQNPIPNRSFKIEGNFGKQKCTITKSFKDVHNFVNAIKNQIKNSEIIPYLEELLKLNGERLNEENWVKARELLQETIMFLAKLPQVRDSTIFQDFIPFKPREQLLNAFASTSPSKSNYASVKHDENRNIFDNGDLSSTKSKHSRKESNRYLSGKESSGSKSKASYKGKKPVAINSGVGTTIFYESFDN